jgi:uncharacterized OB-fold protein
VHGGNDPEEGGVTQLEGELRAHNAPPAEMDAGLPLQRCRDCGRHPNYPRIRCPFCLGELEWIKSDGSGTVVDLAIVRRPHDARYEPFVPIVMAHIALDEQVEVIATIIGENRLEAKIGDRVVAAAQAGWSALTQFELDARPAEGNKANQGQPARLP